MRIVSLLPAATEIVYLLGLGDDLCGVSFECDHPADARTKPIVSGTSLPTDASLSAAEIDAEVRATVGGGGSLYTLDDARLRAIDPELILAQDLCQVCAVPAGAVDRALESVGCRAEVVSLDPSRLDDVIAAVGAVGRATGTEQRAEVVMAELRTRLDVVRERAASRMRSGAARPRVLFVEWPEPMFNAGHWVPDMIDCAGGTAVLAAAGERSRRLSWEEVKAVAIDVTVFSPCGFDLDGAVGQAAALLARPDVGHLGQMWAVDANAHFSRPGPRVVDGVEILAEILDDRPATPPGKARRLA